MKNTSRTKTILSHLKKGIPIATLLVVASCSDENKQESIATTGIAKTTIIDAMVDHALDRIAKTTPKEQEATQEDYLADPKEIERFEKSIPENLDNIVAYVEIAANDRYRPIAGDYTIECCPKESMWHFRTAILLLRKKSKNLAIVTSLPKLLVFVKDPMLMEVGSTKFYAQPVFFYRISQSQKSKDSKSEKTK